MTQPRKHILDSLGISEDERLNAVETVDEIKRTERRRRQMIEFPHSATVGKEKVHLFQDVRETLDSNPFTDGEVVEWTVCEIDPNDEELLLKKAHANWQDRWVTFEEFAEGSYEPIYCEYEGERIPRFGY